MSLSNHINLGQYLNHFYKSGNSQIKGLRLSERRGWVINRYGIICRSISTVTLLNVL